MLAISWSVCHGPGKPLQPSLMFVGKASGLPYSGAPAGCCPKVGSGLTGKLQTRLNSLGRDNHYR